MRLLNRKPGKYALVKANVLLTPAKLKKLEFELEKLKKKRPQAAAEVARLAELGDFSENVEYQLAKRRLRGINGAILRLEHQIKTAEIIEPAKSNDTVAIGHTVTVTDGQKEKIYQILGSSETDPARGIISHLSPIGSALLGKKVGDSVVINLKNRHLEYKIIKI